MKAPEDDFRFAEIFTTLGEVYGEKLTDGRLRAYFNALADLTIEQVAEAAEKWMNTGRFFPKPVEFREMLVGSTNDQAENAWRTFVKLCVDEGHYPSLQVLDAAFAFAIDHLGGWIAGQAKLNQANVQMVRAYEDQFKVSYRLGKTHPDAAPKYFKGQIESENSLARGKMFRNQGSMLKIKVCVVEAGGYTRLEMPMDLNTGALADRARAALVAGNVSEFMERPIARKALPPPEPNYPPPSDEEVEKWMRQVEKFTLKHMPENPEDRTH
jgi:hypothetical protein